MLDLSALRQEYTNAELNERDAQTQPFLQFEDWFLQAQKSEVPEPNAMGIGNLRCPQPAPCPGGTD